MTLVNYLLTNDDGIDAPGLAALKNVVSGNGNCIVVAPSEEQSGCSHRTTTNDPFKIHQVDERCFAVEGTPADCVRVGLHRFRDDFELVLAGINAAATSASTPTIRERLPPCGKLRYTESPGSPFRTTAIESWRPPTGIEPCVGSGRFLAILQVVRGSAELCGTSTSLAWRPMLGIQMSFSARWT